MRTHQAGAVVVAGGQGHSLSLKTSPDKKQGASPEGGTSIEKMHRSPQGGINNNYSVEMRIQQQQQQQQQQQSFYPNAQCSHQCQGFHATPANTPTLWGGIASSTKYPNDSSRPPTPSFPPYDVRTLHFVACGRPWLLHWRMGTTTTTWIDFQIFWMRKSYVFICFLDIAS